MPTTSVTSSIVQTLGGGSGIDMAALAESLATAQFAARIDRNATQAETVDRQISAVSTLRGQITQLASAVGDRVRNGDLSVQPQIANGAVGVITNSWATRLRRDDTMVVQIDGTDGSAVAGRHLCFTQAAANTPEAFFGASHPGGMDHHSHWEEVPDDGPPINPFRQCWEAFLRHVAEDAPYLPTLVEGAKAVQLADLAYRSVEQQRWMSVPDLRL